MYFKQPSQLLDVFAQLEEQNLFLIQNSQETEKALEELKQNFETTKEQMDGKARLLNQNISELEDQITGEDGACPLFSVQEQMGRIVSFTCASMSGYDTVPASIPDVLNLWLRTKSTTCCHVRKRRAVVRLPVLQDGKVTS